MTERPSDPVRLISALAALCREHPTAEKIVVVPSLALGHQLGDRLARLTPWINLRFETIRTLVDGVVGLDIATDGLTILSRAQSLALVEQACREVLTPGSYFGEIADRPGLHRAIQRTLDDLRHAGVAPSAFKDRFEDPRKGEELQAILSRYEEFLAGNDFIDRAGTLRRALETLRENPPEPKRPILSVVETVELTAAEGELLSLLAGGAYVTLAVGEPTPMPDSTFFQAIGEENEVREVLRRILGEGIPLDDAEIVYSVSDSYAQLVYELVAEHGIPCTFMEGVAAPFTQPGQAAIGFLRWVGSDFDASLLRGLCIAGAMKLPDDEAIAPAQIGRIVRDAQIGWGRDRYARCLDSFQNGLRARLASEEDETQRERLTLRIERTFSAKHIIVRWLDLVPVPDNEGLVDLPALARAAKAFVERHARVGSEQDAFAKAAIASLLGELASLPSTREPMAACADRLTDAVATLLVGSSNPRPGALHASPLSSGGYSGRRRVFFVGLDDTRVPGAGLQDPVLLDAERSRINDAIDPRKLSLLGDAPARKTELFSRCVALAAPESEGARLTFSYSSRDLLREREQFPAAVMLQAFRWSRADEALGYDALLQVTRAAEASFIPNATPLDLTEWWLQHLDGGPGALAEALRAEYPWLARGAAAAAARDSEALTAYDGMIDFGAAIDPRKTGRVVSPTELEKLAGCPFSWFLERVLRIRPLDEERRDPAVWLDPAQLGTFMHDLFERFVKDVVDRGESIDRGMHEERLKSLAEASLIEWRDRIPPASETSFETTKGDVLRGCEIFLDVETRRAGVTPVALEATFGRSSDAPTPLDSEEPVEIPLGRKGTLCVGGRIDRVDRVGNKHDYEVWDYKTGSTFDYPRRGRLHRGTKLQHAIYALAAEELLRRSGVKSPRVTQSGYYFPMEKGGGQMIAKETAEGALEATLNLLFDILEDGVFPHGVEGGCRFCRFETICGGAAIAGEQFARKAEATPDRKAVKAWQQLQEVE